MSSDITENLVQVSDGRLNGTPKRHHTHLPLSIIVRVGKVNVFTILAKCNRSDVLNVGSAHSPGWNGVGGGSACLGGASIEYFSVGLGHCILQCRVGGAVCHLAPY